MRVGAISFLNALPLLHGLPWPVETAPPNVIQARLLDGVLDLALCSVTTALCHEGIFLLPGCGIGSRGAVASVRLLFRNGVTHPRQCRRIALDPESNTANLLLKVLLEKYYDRPISQVEFIEAADRADARLVIGDRALHEPSQSPAIDLGAVWTDWTGLPFVFAAWLTTRQLIPAEIRMTLLSTRDRNLAQLTTLAAQFVPPPWRERLAYLRTHISYALGEEECAGLDRFHGYLMDLGLAPRRSLPLLS